MKYFAEINIMPHQELLDPQGKTVTKNMKNLSVTGVDDVRIGKHVHMRVTADSETEAREKVEIACRKLLANMIMETFTYEIVPVEE